MFVEALRAGGPAMIGGAILLGAATIAIAFDPTVGRQPSPGMSLLLIASSALLLVSFPAMYARQGDASGVLGLAGYALLQLGLVLPIVVASTPLLHPAVEAPGEHPVLLLLGIAFVVGLLLTAIATVTAGVFPQGAGLLLLAATASFFFIFFVAEFLPPIAMRIGDVAFGVVLALGFAWIGLSLWSIGAG